MKYYDYTKHGCGGLHKHHIQNSMDVGEWILFLQEISNDPDMETKISRKIDDVLKTRTTKVVLEETNANRDIISIIKNLGNTKVDITSFAKYKHYVHIEVSHSSHFHRIITVDEFGSSEISALIDLYNAENLEGTSVWLPSSTDSNYGGIPHHHRIFTYKIGGAKTVGYFLQKAIEIKISNPSFSFTDILKNDLEARGVFEKQAPYLLFAL